MVKSGEKWWKIFGYSRQLPSTLDLHVTCVMPSNENKDESFADTILKIGDDSFHLHYMYFEEKDNSFVNIKTSIKNCINY